MGEGGNASSVHQYGRHARKYVEDARQQVANLCHVSPEQIIFTSGATESINTVLCGHRDKPVFISDIEHPATIAAAPHASRIPVTKDGVVDVAVYQNMLKNDPPALVSIMLVNSETGVIQPIAEMAKLAHEVGALFHTDAVQGAGRIDISLDTLGVDFISLSAHKMAGPQGVGTIVTRAGIEPPKFMLGGSQEKNCRAGTYNAPGIAGMGLAAELALKNLDHYAALEKMRDHMEKQIHQISNSAIIYGENAPRVGNTCNVGLPGVPAQTQMMALDLDGISVSSGSACSSGSFKPSHVLTAMSVDEEAAKSALRISLDGTQKQIDAALGLSLMEVAVKEELEPIEGACGGGLACATCHLYVHPDFKSKTMPEDDEISEDEEDMLDLAFDVRDSSRLCCQIIVTEDMNGMTVAMPGADVDCDKTRMVIEMNEATKFRTFMLPQIEGKPYRLVVDLPDFNWQAGTIKRPAKTTVLDVRSGKLKPGTQRLVIDLEQPAKILKAFLLPAGGGKPDRLVIDYTAITKAQFAATKRDPIGTLPASGGDLNLLIASQTANDIHSKKTPETSSGSMIVPTRKPATIASSVQKAAPPQPSSKTTSPLRKPLIIIDAGHGGQDPGAVGAENQREKNVTLAAAKALKKSLEKTGRYRVSLTRDNDKYLKLYKRVSIARQQEADLFISLHADSIGKSNVSGASIYTLSNKASDAQTAKLAQRENQADLIAGVDLSHEDKDVANILIDLAMRDTMNQSKFFANTVVSQMQSRGIRVLPRPHRYAGFAVLKAPDIPSVLVEMGFMSNKKEARLLATSSYQQKIAAALTDSVNNYFQKVAENNR
ncbi:unnamed protein product [Cyprideis torosa]|uniref:cysteine desulfurase n=1 Tax=Cyprideis torosa TaxID=163714 RepID=A0A7R8ZVB7_9CRUS|nr:unnamed protein product [Cyprideis torosa]CAG0902364.1 unnamed protein product [Cyprideis torosa]